MVAIYIHVCMCNMCGEASLLVSKSELANFSNVEELRRGRDCPRCLGGQVHHVGRVKVEP